ncbi:hypothetical protein ABT112_08165 [Streptomyces sp. NPDC002055]|uniref:hypothetical protein n=1 Tax=Streptomyces sp. NPDC002055 TaxID=3154534 RepID=UPI00332523A8
MSRPAAVSALRRTSSVTRRRIGSLAPLLLVLAGCGIQPTGVIDAGEPATGLTRGMRVYFASDQGLRGVPRPETELRSVGDPLKLLAAGPTEEEQRTGLTNLVPRDLAYSATADGGRVVLSLAETEEIDPKSMGTGQLVCSLARAQSLLDKRVRPDDVQVTLRPDHGAPVGPYRCSQFLGE